MTYRPIGARIISYVVAGCFLLIFGVIVAQVPSEVREQTSIAQSVTLILFFVAALGVLHGIGRTRIRTDEQGVHVLNGYRSHDLEWAEVISIEFGRGAPWAVADTSEGTTVSLMAIQAADGPRARAAVRRLRSEIAEHS